ncbi:hypothetical protein AMAG_07906 [Allomyces macrogynus ATCC 38327]|uniref:Uncharacterized protein n=1 Tax=Allomyces macrogynus (strain ATCC 38327) TaxID=578462 RepID=A0A0L0SJV8_ALLM3|nr:hypothetical protein AMAG_07906 [Allomyces macrogynus ATCC 38327]|eukprot:KNE62719.1 hypothetical protein AMAG_07906 [Allomyces macrogynus ATCC 38327]
MQRRLRRVAPEPQRTPLTAAPAPTASSPALAPTATRAATASPSWPPTASGAAAPAPASAPAAAAGKPRKRPNLSLSSLPFKAGSPGSTASSAAACPISPRTTPSTAGTGAAPVPLRINLAHVRAMTAPAGLALHTQFPLLSTLGAQHVAPNAPVWLHALFATGGAMSDLQGASSPDQDGRCYPARARTWA